MGVPIVEMILLDWTRMGSSYCLAGVVTQEGRIQVVRPLLARSRNAPVRNVGWSAYLMDGHARWEVFELIGPAPAPQEPPHLEDVWVRALSPQKALASPERRRAILAQTVAASDEPIFGVPLATTRSAAYLLPGTGRRSLTTVIVPVDRIRFEGSWRQGATEPDMRAWIPVGNLGERLVPVKDHHLLKKTEAAGSNPGKRAKMLNLLIQQMGEQVAVRLGLSRAFQGRPDGGQSLCWVMADGFFSLSDPQT
jgi:hypothetical protein